MKKLHQYTSVLFLLFAIHQTAFASEPSYRKLIINKGDSTIHISVCPSNMEVNCKKNVLYHWYNDNRLHQNKGNYSGRLIHGELKTYDYAGNLVEVGQMKYGVKKGIWIKWHANGEVKQKTIWRQGMKSGTEYHYASNGNLMMKRKYFNDQKIGNDIVYMDGKKVKAEKIKKHKRDKGEKKLKVEIFDKEESKKERKRERENREKYHWFKNLLKKKEVTGDVS